MIIVTARFRSQPNRQDRLVALLAETQQASRGDGGCLGYGYYADVADPTNFVAVEQWRDRQALDEHLAQPHVRRLVEALPQLVAGTPEIVAHEVVRSGPLIAGRQAP